MNTVNIVLMMVLCTIIGFTIGNAWGRTAMKKAFMNLLDEITKEIKVRQEKTEEE